MVSGQTAATTATISISRESESTATGEVNRHSTEIPELEFADTVTRLN